MSDLIHAAAYVRVSTLEQVKGESLDLQKKAVSDYAAAKGYILFDTFEDAGVSGGSTDRPALQRLLRHAEARDFSILIVNSLDRFGRNARDTLNLSHELESYGVSLVSVKESISADSPSQRMFRTQLSAFAEFERDTIRERMQGGRIAKWIRGDAYFGRQPYGLKWNTKEKRFDVVEDEARVINLMVDFRLNHGLSYESIALKLKEMGLKSRPGKNGLARNFRPFTILFILSNPAMYGKLFTKNFTFNTPPIIPKDIWDRLQEKSLFNKAKSKRITTAGNFWLRDLLTCGQCGASIKPKNDTPIGYYKCYWSRRSRKKLELAKRIKCELPPSKAEQLESDVETAVMHALRFDAIMGGDENLLQLFSSERHEDRKAGLELNLASVAAELGKKERALKRLMDTFEDMEFKGTHFREKYHSYTGEIETLKSRSDAIHNELKELDVIIAESAAFMDFIKENRDWIENVQKELMALSPADKKRFYESILQGKITLHLDSDVKAGIPEHVTFQLPSIRLNLSIFQSLIDAGKLSPFNQNNGDQKGPPGDQ